MGYVVLDADGGQVPWHNHEQEEVYLLLEGSAEMCLGEERMVLGDGQAVYIPSGVFHQLTNVGSGSGTFYLLLWAGGGCGALAAGVGGDAAAGGV